MLKDNMYPPLPKPYKGLFPFRLAVPSYIYPDNIIPNVEMLAPFVDEIELILFESGPDQIPTRNDITRLVELASETGIRYNVHLPTDVSVTDPDPDKRAEAVDIMKRVMDLTACLSPSTWTLHVPFREPSTRADTLHRWRDRAGDSIRKLDLHEDAARAVSIETLNYPFEFVAPVLAEARMSACMDLGHLLRDGRDVRSTFDTYAHLTTAIHIHGIENGRDHRPLDRLSMDDAKCIASVIRGFTGSVCVEVFSYKKLKASLVFLELLMDPGHVESR